MSERVDVVEHSNFRTIIVSGAIGIATKNNIQITLYSDDLNPNDYASDPNLKTGQIRARRVIECRLLMDPVAAKSLQNVVNSSISDFEKMFGEIKKPERTAEPSKDDVGTNVSTPYK